MAQCALQMRTAAAGFLRGETRRPALAAGAGGASRLASVAQGWRALNVAQLRGDATLGRARERNLVAVRAAEEPKLEGDNPTGFGLGGKDSFFGFGGFQELQVGRLAMVGWTAAVVMEVITGKGVLGQLGINPSTVKGPLLAGLLFLLVGGLLGGYVVITNPPDVSKAPPNAGDGLPRNPLQTFDAKTADPLTTYTRGGQDKEPYVSDLDLPPKK